MESKKWLEKNRIELLNFPQNLPQYTQYILGDTEEKIYLECHSVD